MVWAVIIVVCVVNIGNIDLCPILRIIGSEKTHSRIFKEHQYSFCNNSPQCSVIKASRAAAEGGRVLPESHAPDEVSLCVLLLQPPVGSQYSH